MKCFLMVNFVGEFWFKRKGMIRGVTIIDASFILVILQMSIQVIPPEFYILEVNVYGKVCSWKTGYD